MRRKLHLDTSAVQGDGSWIDLKAPSWSAAKEFITSSQDGDEQERGLAMVDALVPLCVVDWNWTDEEDKILPLPADPNSLTMDEMLWLVPHISSFMAPEKN
jgi:hypothetical protein